MVIVNDLLDLVLQEYVDNGHASIVSLRSHLKHLRHILGPIDVDTISRDSVTRYVTLRKGAKASVATINRELAVLRRAGKLGMEHELISRFVPIKLLRGENVRQGFFEYEDFMKVREHLTGIYERPFIFAYYNGRRRGEILKYKRSDVNLELRMLTVRGEITKNGKGGPLPLDGECWEAVRFAHQASPGPYLFGKTTGQSITLSTFYRTLKQAFAKAGVPERHFHDLRRTASRNLIRAGNHRKVAKSITGHITDSMFDRYDIVDTADMISAVRKVQEYISHKNQGLVINQTAEEAKLRPFLHKEDSNLRPGQVIVVPVPPKVSLFSRIKNFIKGGES